MELPFKELNLPEYNYRIRRQNKQYSIYDPFRRRYVVLTPEEWVRQHLGHYLISDIKCPKRLLKVEASCVYGELVKRVDMVVYQPTGDPWMIVECKAAHHPLDGEVAYQAACYNVVWQAPLLLISNGIAHYCYALDRVRRCYTPLAEVPRYGSSY